MSAYFSRLLLVILGLFGMVLSYGQHDDGIFAFGLTEDGKPYSEKYSFMNPSEKYQRCKKVFDRLVEARGVKSALKPELVITNGEEMVAWAIPSTGEIGLEEKAVDICLGFGEKADDALSTLIAHELSHFYEKHDWARNFAEEFDNLPTADKLKQLDRKIALETEADFAGGFLAFSAGYNPQGIMPELLDKIYADYNLKSDLKGYPTLEERKAIARQTLAKIYEYWQVFQLANFQVLVGAHERARKNFRYILQEYQSREIHNNIGVLYALEAITLFTNKELEFIYPIELDANSRLSEGTRSNKADRLMVRARLLDEAIGELEAATTLDEHYLPAWINLGCVYALKEKWRDARYAAETAIEFAEEQQDPGTVQKAKVLMGIIAAKQGDKKVAKAFFAEAKGNELAEANSTLLKGEPLELSGVSTLVKEKFEQIDNVQLEKVENQVIFRELNEDLKITFDRKNYILLKDYDQSSLLIDWIDRGEEYFFFQQTLSDYEGATAKGVELGASEDQVSKVYGKEFTTIHTTEGKFIHYPVFQLLFKISEQGKVVQWVVYRVKR